MSGFQQYGDSQKLFNFDEFINMLGPGQADTDVTPSASILNSDWESQYLNLPEESSSISGPTPSASGLTHHLSGMHSESQPQHVSLQESINTSGPALADTDMTPTTSIPNNDWQYLNLPESSSTFDPTPTDAGLTPSTSAPNSDLPAPQTNPQGHSGVLSAALPGPPHAPCALWDFDAGRINGSLSDDSGHRYTYRELWWRHPEWRARLQADVDSLSSVQVPDGYFHQSIDDLDVLAKSNNIEGFGPSLPTDQEEDFVEQESLVTAANHDDFSAVSHGVSTAMAAPSTTASPIPEEQTLSSLQDISASPVTHPLGQEQEAMLQVPQSPEAPSGPSVATHNQSSQQVPADEAESWKGIDNPGAANFYLAHLASDKWTPINPPDDDLETVQGKQQDYAKRFYDALRAKEEKPLPEVKTLPEGKKAFFEAQQTRVREKIRDKMETHKQKKIARAQCMLAVEAACAVHSIGVPAELYDASVAGQIKKSDRQSQLDHCKASERLEKMLVAVMNVKTIAQEVLDGKPLEIFARAPDSYVSRKVVGTVSNAKRQDRINVLSKSHKESTDTAESNLPGPSEPAKKTSKRKAKDDGKKGAEGKKRKKSAK